jgi:uncharacterized ferritin-like protein (DUF455 family)
MSHTEEINDFAIRVLFGHALEDKLRTPGKLIDEKRDDPLKLTPSAPSRSAALKLVTSGAHRRHKRELRPTVERLADPIFRGRILHTFAHHELISLELMALALLRFPDAPKPFRRGLAQVMIDEQKHFRMYEQRVISLGLDLGEEPVSDYFWRCVAHSPDIASFNARLGLVFEQANIDFTRHYAPLFREVGDEESGGFLDEIYKDEISHVGLGLHWFRKWRPNHEPEWDSFCQLLAPPLSPGRAKGTVFSVDGRREAGFSEEYIQTLKLWGGSTGRPPVVWLGNFDFDDELQDLGVSQGLLPADRSPKRRKKRRQLRAQLRHALTPLLGWVCTRGDLIHCPKSKPSPQLQALMLKAKGVNPEWVTNLDVIRDRKLGGLSPWGWSCEAFDQLSSLNDSILSTGVPLPKRETIDQLYLYSAKHWSQHIRDSVMNRLREHDEPCPLYSPSDTERFIWDQSQSVASLVNRLEDMSRGQFKEWICKRAYGSAGRGLKRLNIREPLDEPTIGWLKRSLPLGVTVEPWLDRVADLSFHGHVDGEVVHYDGEIVGIVDGNGQFQGAHLGPPMSVLSQELKRFLNGDGLDRRRLSRIGKTVVHTIGNQLKASGFQGPFGVDALICRTQEGGLKLYPLVEVNPRYTMGRLALKLRRCFDPRGNMRARVIIYPKLSMIPEEVKSSMIHDRFEDSFDPNGQWQGSPLPLNDYWMALEEEHSGNSHPVVLLMSQK